MKVDVADSSAGTYTTPWYNNIDGTITIQTNSIPGHLIISYPAEPVPVKFHWKKTVEGEGLCADCDELTNIRRVIYYLGEEEDEIEWCVDCFNFHKEEDFNGLNTRIESAI